METRPPWLGVFEIVDGAGDPAPQQGLPLTQVTDKEFEVGATIRYLGETGLDPSLDDKVRVLTQDVNRRTDLASVPAALRWFVRPHGVHTPAALFHDHLLETGKVEPEDADRLFLFMLKELRVPKIKRNLMWTGVALRTRWVKSPATLVLWVALSILGWISFLLAVAGVDFPDWTGGRWVVLTVATLAPLPASLLWGRERRAALVAAVMAIWILPAAALALLALVAYGVLERAVSRST